MNYLTTNKVVVYLAVIFIAGGAAGAVITSRNTRREAQPVSIDKICTRMQDRLIAKLGLTEAQITKLRPIFDRTAQELRAVQVKALGDSDEIIRKAHEQMAAELTADQKAKLAEFDQERRAWIQRRLECGKSKTP